MNEEEKIKEILIKSLLEFKNKDLPIMKNNSSERAKVHRVAMYMENFMKQENFDKDYVVDCEYSYNDNSSPTYRIIAEYEVDGIKYKSMSHTAKNA